MGRSHVLFRCIAQDGERQASIGQFHYRGLPRELQTLCKNKAVKAAVLASMRSEGKAAKLNSFEQVISCLWWQ